MKTIPFTIACLQAATAVASVLPVDVKSLQFRAANIQFDPSCDSSKQATINAEIAFAKAMADAASSNVQGQNGFYYQSFFSKNVRADTGFPAAAQSVFNRASQLLSTTVSTYPLKFTCINTQSKCTKPAYFAYVTNKSNTINFCDAFFNPASSNIADPPTSTQNRLNSCSSITIRQAHRSLSVIILHELMHTSYASFGQSSANNQQFIDVAYGWADTVNLQLGVFNRGQAAYAGTSGTPCKDSSGKDGICNADLCKTNADSYAFTAAGLWYSQKCGREIPDPNGSTTVPTSKVTGPSPPEQPEDPPSDV